MMRRVKLGLLFALTLALTVVGTGCPDATPVSSGAGSAILAVNNGNVGKWEAIAIFQIDRIGIRPLDPEADAVAGTRDFLLINESIVVDGFTPVVDPQNFSAVYLAPGTYRITELILSNMTFWELAPEFLGDECEFIDAFDTVMTNFTTDLTFTVPPDSDVVVTMNFDISAMATAIEASYADPLSAIYYPDCFGDLDPDLFAANLPTFLTID